MPELGFDALIMPAPAASQVSELPVRQTRSRWLLCGWIAALLCGSLGLAGSWLALTATKLSGAFADPEPAGFSAREYLPPEPPLGTVELSPHPGSGAADGGSGNSRADPDWVRRMAASTGIPERAMQAYADAAARLAREQPECGLGWNTLAAIGYVESDHGRFGGGHLNAAGVATPAIVGIALDGSSTDAIADTDGGALDGDPVWDHAVGPMQFIPAAWAEWGADGNGDGVADPQQIDDAAYAAGRYLCAAGDLRTASGWINAIASYNNTIEYNHQVAAAAEQYALRAAAQ